MLISGNERQGNTNPITHFNIRNTQFSDAICYTKAIENLNRTTVYPICVTSGLSRGISVDYSK